MGNLSQYAEQIQGVQSRLDEADSMKENMDDMISKRFEEVSNKMMKSLEGLVCLMLNHCKFIMTV